MFFFTVVLADRSSELLVKHIERLRQVSNQKRIFPRTACGAIEVDEPDGKARNGNLRNDGFGSMPSATTLTSSVTSITSTLVR
jgi:hypothetical protein